LTGAPVDVSNVSYECRRIVDMCQAPVTVADLASALALPLVVVRVLLGDLVHDGLVDVRVAAPTGRVTDQHLLARVLAGIRAL
jgi:predicted ArsR family transcriptional regulator